MNRFEPLPNMACEITPELEQRIKDLSQEGTALHIGIMPAIYVEVKVFKKDGTVKTKKKYKANSLTRNFWNMMVMFLVGKHETSGTHGEGSLVIKRVSGANESSANSGAVFYGAGYAGDGYPNYFGIRGNNIYANSPGIKIGTSDAAENFGDYNLGAAISHGTSTGQMSFMSPSTNEATYNAENKTWSKRFSRIFHNTSGAAIDVKECGIFGSNGTGGDLILQERTVFPSSETVDNNELIEITYTIVFHYPEPEAS
jgi:hypothetical protein